MPRNLFSSLLKRIASPQKTSFLAVLWMLLWLPGWGWAREGRVEPPRLVVLVVMDQFRADYLVRFRSRFGEGGFERLMREGASFDSCFYPYVHTVTAPGHATLATGTTPERHGITGNDWYDFEEGREVESVEDSTYPVVGGRGGPTGVSPRSLLVETLGDRLREESSGRAKVYGVALKDRAAVLATGRRAQAAYWYDDEAGVFVTSRYYAERLPNWVAEFDRTRGAKSYHGKVWQSPGRVLFELATSEEDNLAEVLNAELKYTPYGNELVLSFAQELVLREGLGKDDTPDFLFVGLSANDHVGHRWGPFSEEVAEMTAATDAQLAEWLRFLDRRIGKENYWLVLTADHGVAPTVEQAQEVGLEPKVLSREGVRAAAEEALEARWGKDEWIADQETRGFYLSREALRRHGASLEAAAAAVGEAMRKFDGVIGYAGAAESFPNRVLEQAYRAGVYPGRAPDLEIFLEPFTFVGAGMDDASHGSQHYYDTHVPLMFYGAAFRPGVYSERVSPADVAPTLAAALALSPLEAATGRNLAEVWEDLSEADKPAGEGKQK